MEGQEDIREALFLFGQVLGTQAALQAMKTHAVSPESLLRRHIHGDWGSIGEEEKRENELAVKHRSHILSAYQITDGVRVWLLTEADRTRSIFFLTGEY